MKTNTLDPSTRNDHFIMFSCTCSAYKDIPTIGAKIQSRSLQGYRSKTSMLKLLPKLQLYKTKAIKRTFMFVNI